MPDLIATPAHIWLAVEPVDMRRDIDGLSAHVQQTLGHAPCAGAAFVFRNKSDNRIKVRIPVKAATQTAGMRPPKPFKEATLSERSDAGGLFLLYLISCRQICLLFS